MAVVEGPLHSTNARGSIFGTMTFFGWKGIHVVRNRVDPVQPRSAAVMNLRIKLKALGKVSKVFSSTSTLTADMKVVTPARKNWNAWWIGVAIKQFQKDNDDYDDLVVSFGAAAAAGQFVTEAAALGLLPQTLEVEGHASDHPATYEHSIALYSLAKASWFMEVLDEGSDPYTDPEAWDAAAVTAFKGRIVD